MTVKTKILQALSCALDEISEERLIDILLILAPEGENAHERELIHAEREQMRDEMPQDAQRPIPWSHRSVR